MENVMDNAQYTSQQIADWFLCNIDYTAGDSITHLKLQKLVYYAQSWSLAIFNQPLFDEDFEAWVHGPALRSLYQKYKKYGWEGLPQPSKHPSLDDPVPDLLRDIVEIYGTQTAKRIETLTHSETPWIEARNGLPADAPSNAKISKETMRKFYTSLLEKSKANG